MKVFGKEESTMRKLVLPVMIGTVFFGVFVHAQGPDETWIKRVVITNDDGIDDGKVVKLAEAFSKIAETYLIVPNSNRSSSTHYCTVYSQHVLKSELRKNEPNLKVYTVDGYPADCVFLALKGIMKDHPPDLVVSGINDGPNLGFDWMASGTIGAARMAAYWGVPAIAVSGLRESIDGSLDAAIEWVIRLSGSNLVKDLKPRQYLTVSIPRVSPNEIKGIKVTKRAGILLDFEMQKVGKDESSESTQIWQLLQPKRITDVDPGSDAELYNQNYIVIVPMIADEMDRNLLEYMNMNIRFLPPWTGKKQP